MTLVYRNVSGHSAALSINGTASAGLDGRVVRASWLGDHVEYGLESELGPLFALDHSGRPALAPGTAVTIGFADRGLALLAD